MFSKLAVECRVVRLNPTKRKSDTVNRKLNITLFQLQCANYNLYKQNGKSEQRKILQGADENLVWHLIGLENGASFSGPITEQKQCNPGLNSNLI